MNKNERIAHWLIHIETSRFHGYQDITTETNRTNEESEYATDKRKGSFAYPRLLENLAITSTDHGSQTLWVVKLPEFFNIFLDEEKSANELTSVRAPCCRCRHLLVNATRMQRELGRDYLQPGR